jgi:hypothetical protein
VDFGCPVLHHAYEVVIWSENANGMETGVLHEAGVYRKENGVGVVGEEVSKSGKENDRHASAVVKERVGGSERYDVVKVSERQIVNWLCLPVTVPEVNCLDWTAILIDDLQVHELLA